VTTSRKGTKIYNTYHFFPHLQFHWKSRSILFSNPKSYLPLFSSFIS